MNAVPFILAGLAVAWIALAMKMRGSCSGHDMEVMPNADPGLHHGGHLRVIAAYEPELGNSIGRSLVVQEYVVLGCQHDNCLHTKREWRTVTTYSRPENAPDWVQDAAIPEN